ncbi:LOW QUALITY PROTEIN: hypothetical protein MC885_013933, partial [Smutsia gigantea]
LHLLMGAVLETAEKESAVASLSLHGHLLRGPLGFPGRPSPGPKEVEVAHAALPLTKFGRCGPPSRADAEPGRSLWLTPIPAVPARSAVRSLPLLGRGIACTSPLRYLRGVAARLWLSGLCPRAPETRLAGAGAHLCPGRTEPSGRRSEEISRMWSIVFQNHICAVPYLLKNVWKIDSSTAAFC